MNNEDTKAQLAFEAWHAENGRQPAVWNGEEYDNKYCQYRWQGWQARGEYERQQSPQPTGQLPEGMEHCTILYKECDKGHGRLTAKNWIDHGCHWCKIELLKAAQPTDALVKAVELPDGKPRRWEGQKILEGYASAHWVYKQQFAKHRVKDNVWINSEADAEALAVHDTVQFFLALASQHTQPSPPSGDGCEGALRYCLNSMLAVLCDPEDEPCFVGSDGDRQVIRQAIAQAIAALHPETHGGAVC